jgi:hypothetical protein
VWRRAVVKPQPMLLTKVISSAPKVLALNFKSELTFDVIFSTPLNPNNSKHRFVFRSKESKEAKKAPVWRQGRPAGLALYNFLAALCLKCLKSKYFQI